jgi:hypothetical protein
VPIELAFGERVLRGSIDPGSGVRIECRLFGRPFNRAILVNVSSTAPPVVDPIRRPHLALVDPAFRRAIERDIEHCRELLTFLRDR